MRDLTEHVNCALVSVFLEWPCASIPTEARYLVNAVSPKERRPRCALRLAHHKATLPSLDSPAAAAGRAARRPSSTLRYTCARTRSISLGHGKTTYEARCLARRLSTKDP